MSTPSAMVESTAALIRDRFVHSPSYASPFRFALALGQRASFHGVPLDGPSLDIGVNDGSTAAIVHHGKPRICWGGDMPEESTTESRGLFVSPPYNVYHHLVGMDACEIPFPDNSFSTVVSTEVFFYGMDRARLLSEIVRVLAPGGTLAFSESSPAILEFPGLTARLKEEIPAFNVPTDPRNYYQNALTELGMRDVYFRPYFDKSVAAMTLHMLYSGLHADRQRPLVHRDGLAAVTALMKREFESAHGPEDGFNVFVSCRKPGVLDRHRPVPQPRCLLCGHRDLDRTFERCVCPACGHHYQTRFGRPYLLRDYSTAYCPKPADRYAPGWAQRLEQRIASSLHQLYRDAVTLLGPSQRLMLAGVDASTDFTLAHIRTYGRGIEVTAVCTLESACIGHVVGGLQIVDPGDAATRDLPLLLSGLGAKQHVAVAERLRQAGHRGRIVSMADAQVHDLSGVAA